MANEFRKKEGLTDNKTLKCCNEWGKSNKEITNRVIVRQRQQKKWTYNCSAMCIVHTFQTNPLL